MKIGMAPTILKLLQTGTKLSQGCCRLGGGLLVERWVLACAAENSSNFSPSKQTALSFCKSDIHWLVNFDPCLRISYKIQLNQFESLVIGWWKNNTKQTNKQLVWIWVQHFVCLQFGYQQKLKLPVGHLYPQNISVFLQARRIFMFVCLFAFGVCVCIGLCYQTRTYTWILTFTLWTYPQSRTVLGHR